MAQTAVTAVSGTPVSIPITLGGEGDEVPDTLFKAWTWFEIQVQDSAAWTDSVSQDYLISGSGLDDADVTGNSTAGIHDYYKYWIFDVAGDDSIIWGHYHYDGDSMSTLLDTALITASAQVLDSGISLNFNADAGHTHNDTFMFLASDSLNYGKTTHFRIRMGLNLHRR